MDNSSESYNLVLSNFSLLNAWSLSKKKKKKIKQTKLNVSSLAQHYQSSMFGPRSHLFASFHLCTTSSCFIGEKLCSDCLDGGEAESSCVMMADRLYVGCSLARSLSLPNPSSWNRRERDDAHTSVLCKNKRLPNALRWPADLNSRVVADEGSVEGWEGGGSAQRRFLFLHARVHTCTALGVGERRAAMFVSGDQRQHTLGCFFKATISAGLSRLSFTPHFISIFPPFCSFAHLMDDRNSATRLFFSLFFSVMIKMFAHTSSCLGIFSFC